MLQPKKPIKKSNQTTGEFNALMKEYRVNLRKYELDNNPNQLEGETNESYKQRKKYNDFRIKQAEDKNPVKKWYNEMDASQEADPNFLRKTIRKVATSPIHLANYLDDEINLNDTKKYKSNNKKTKEKVKAGGSALDVVGLATMGTLNKGMKAKPVVEQLLTKATTFFGGNKIQDEIEESLYESIDYLTNLFTSEKDMKPTKKKKYAIGGTVTPMKSPDEIVFNNNLIAEYANNEVANNDWVQGLTAVGGMFNQFGSQMISSGVGGMLANSNPTSSTGQFMKQNSGAIGDMAGNIASFAGNRKQYGKYAMGGQVKQITPIEVEGKEVIETPAGKISKVKGPSHEQGGVDVNVPQGTKIYSDRIKKFGDSMAERKVARENKKLRLEKLLEKNGVDKAIKNTYDRTLSALDKEEQADLQTQEMFNDIMGMMEQFAYGTSQQGVKKYKDGTGKNGVGDKDGDGIPDYIDIDSMNPKPKDMSFSTEIDGYSLYNPNEDISYQIEQNAKLIGDTDSTDNSDDSIPNNKFGNLLEGLGDAIGLYGDVYSAFQPMKNTLENRAGDTPNINAFKDFGKDALASNDASKEYVNQVRNEFLGDLELSRTGSIKRNRNSARGINTLRALDLVTDSQVNEQKENAYSSFAQQMMQILSQQTGLENAQDQAVMTGEYQRDLADRQDRDNFYTQKAKDIATKGQGIQTIGKDVNAMKQNQMMSDIINQLSKYGLGFDKNGQLVQLTKTN